MVSLKSHCKCEHIVREMDELVKNSTALFDDANSCKISGNKIWQMSKYETIILERLRQITDFESVFDSIHASYGSTTGAFRHTILYNLLCEIRKKNLDPNFESLLNVINNKVRYLKRKPWVSYEYYIPALIRFDITDSEKKTLKRECKRSIGLSFDYPSKFIQKKIKSKKLLTLFLRWTLLKIHTTSRDMYYPLNSNYVNKSLYSFLGALALSKNLGRYVTQGRPGPIEEDPVKDQLLVVKDKRKIEYPSDFAMNEIEYTIKVNELSMVGKNTWTIGKNSPAMKYDTLMDILKSISKKPTKLKELSKEVLRLYFEAISEKNLEISFLKFWIITEKVLKSSGKLTDEKLVSTIKKIVKERYLKEMIEMLHKKRNKLVHEFHTQDISQEDRNLAKAISENVILFLIDPPIRIKNVNELMLMIESALSDKNELKSRKSIVNRVLKKRS